MSIGKLKHKLYKLHYIDWSSYLVRIMPSAIILPFTFTITVTTYKFTKQIQNNTTGHSYNDPTYKDWAIIPIIIMPIIIVKA